MRRGKKQAARDISGRHAVTHTWDSSESRLLVCEARELSADHKTKQQKDSYNQSISLTKATMSDTVGRNANYMYVYSVCLIRYIVFLSDTIFFWIFFGFKRFAL